MLITEPFLADQNCIMTQTLKQLCSISRMCDGHIQNDASVDEIDVMLEVKPTPSGSAFSQTGRKIYTKISADECERIGFSHRLALNADP